MADARLTQPVRVVDLDSNNEANVSAAGHLAMAAWLVSGQLVDEAGVVLTVKTKIARVSASGDNAFITAVGGKKIRGLAYAIQAQGTVDAKLQDTNATPVQLSQIWSLQAREGVVFSAPPGSLLFETAVGEGVEVNLSAAVNTDVTVVYVEV